MLFRAAAETLLQIAADPKYLGARIGFLAVLHTWGQNLHHHPHLHCVVTGGGIAPDRRRWIACRRQFLLPVKLLSRLFRAKFVAFLKNAFDQGELGFHRQLEPLGEKTNFASWLREIARSEWVVYAKPPFGGPHQVLKYLARYTHRVAISNQRLVALHDGQVTFRWKDYAQASQPAIMTLQATEFIRRFLLHILPSGFVKIRYFGFLANRDRQAHIQLCRTLLGSRPQGSDAHDVPLKPEPKLAARCPLCAAGCMRPVEILLPQASIISWPHTPLPMAVLEGDTS
jgi:hypothetical protein